MHLNVEWNKFVGKNKNSIMNGDFPLEFVTNLNI